MANKRKWILIATELTNCGPGQVSGDILITHNQVCQPRFISLASSCLLCCWHICSIQTN
jgi:hypothetical protein